MPETDKPQAMRWVPYGHTPCPTCLVAGHVHRQGDTACYHTDGAIHYMRCKREDAHPRFKALDHAELAKMQMLQATRTMEEASADMRTAEIILTARRDRARQAITEYRDAQAAHARARRRLAAVGDRT